MTMSGETARAGEAWDPGRIEIARAATIARTMGRPGARRDVDTGDSSSKQCHFGGRHGNGRGHLRRLRTFSRTVEDRRERRMNGRSTLVEHRHPDAALAGHLDRPLVAGVDVTEDA